MVDRQRSRESSPESCSDLGFEVVNSSKCCISDDEWNEISTSRCQAEHFFIGGADSPRGSDADSDFQDIEELQLQLLTKPGKIALPEVEEINAPSAASMVTWATVLDPETSKGPLPSGWEVRQDPLTGEVYYYRVETETLTTARPEEAAVLANAAEVDASLFGKVSGTYAVRSEFLSNDLAKISAAVAIEAESLNNVLADAGKANANLLAKLSALSTAEAETLNNVLASAAEDDANLLKRISAASALEIDFLNGLACAAA